MLEAKKKLCQLIFSFKMHLSHLKANQAKFISLLYLPQVHKILFPPIYASSKQVTHKEDKVFYQSQ